MCETFIVCQLHNTHGFFHFFMFSISVHSVLLFLISIGLYKSKYLGCLYQLRSDDTDIFPYKTDSAASVVVYPYLREKDVLYKDESGLNLYATIYYVGDW